MEKTRYTIYIDSEVIKQIRIQAIEDGISSSQLLERLAKEYLQKVGK